ncbi:MAG TPA: hypothetical protein VN816_06260 [Acidimicrobiales bacterium]|nr:hypothetical protein [Acidimicrobiales bacterium]
MALMFDVAPNGFRPKQGALADHLTCRSCGGHHAVALVPTGARGPRARADAGPDLEHGVGPGPDDVPSHRCRDCGFQWAEARR